MALHVCVMYNYLETALVLLQKGAAVNRKPNGKTPLHVACTVAHGDCVALLLGHGARVNSLSLSGHTPLHYCITKESVDCAKQLILNGENGWRLNKSVQCRLNHVILRLPSLWICKIISLSRPTAPFPPYLQGAM